jgi:hypothetical protein
LFHPAFIKITAGKKKGLTPAFVFDKKTRGISVTLFFAV